MLVTLSLASTSQAATAPLSTVGTTDAFAILAGSTVTNTGNSVVNGGLGLHPGSAVVGFPPGTVNGEQHIADAVALKAKTDLVTMYTDAAGRPLTATSPPDIGGQLLTSGVYRTGSVPSIGLTGNVTLDGQGDPNAVFIFQIESTLVTASDSSVTLINGTQPCNVIWQVGSSATLGTRTVFRGTILALSAISVNDSVAVQGRLFARNAAVTLINDTITPTACLAGTGPGTGPAAPALDVTGPITRISAPPTTSADCVQRNFTSRFRLSDHAGIRSVRVTLDGKRVHSTKLTRFSIAIEVLDLDPGRHTITVVARDRIGNRSVTRRSFARCALSLAAPRFTG